ncbi:MAG: histidine ammonia-lyase [Bacteroidia bacterium]
MHHISASISIEQIEALLKSNTPITLSNQAIEKIIKCRNYLDEKIKNSNAAFYGINTGFGSLCNTVISETQLGKLQKNLLLSHACGTGEYVPQEIIKLMLLLKIQSLAYGNSGIQLKTVEYLINFYNSNVLPVIYTQGSLGASGDLAPLAHLSLPLVGEGEMWVNEHNEWKIKPSIEVLKQLNLEPIELQSKEGLALINGTQFISAYAIWCILQAEKIYNKANHIAAISLDAFDCRIEPFDELLHQIRPHKGQIHTAKIISALLQGSELWSQYKIHVQDPYAFRCIPQVHGASLDTINYVKSVIETEINSVTDNPNIFVDEDKIISGGNFHAQPLALVLDFLAIALAELASISERRTYQLISGQRNLPPFLTIKPGLNSGFMIPQYTAASIVSQNKQLCTPASVDSIVSSNGQEDHVSMGANAATKCYKVAQNTKTVLAIELMNSIQAIEFRRPLKTSEKLEKIIADYRNIVKILHEDRLLHTDIKKSEQFIDTYVF